MRYSISDLRAEHDRLLAQYERGRGQLATLRERLPKLEGKGSSGDGLVEVTVGARGTLSKVDIQPRAYRKLSPTELGEAIVAAAKKADAKVQEQVRELLAPMLPPGVSTQMLDALMSGEGGIDLWPT